ncbi:ImmA/IrrE family metallo-endopeptidase [Mycobacteroides abscessus]|uniref:ImmA/IrrE family metallo-endopeptidase n=1 Tax=Mycobacteroides abscessus TaxID=36809 RepID=UPI000C26AAAB|nr:ImmA/IrrE family metallo-endopeptidase [Mycobacteroides abscessus]
MLTPARLRHALQEADGLLEELGVDQEAPIDVFDIIDQLGLWLVFNPLKNLLGAAVPKGDGGIMLTTERGVGVQRYTAAHEIGHWILDYGQPTFDTEDDIYHPAADRELLAQVFASQLLMPPPLVFAACTRYGIQGSQTATPPLVYLVARDIGSSYAAAARQLANVGIISSVRRDELLRLKPADIKAELCLGHRPSGAVDVWPVGLDSLGATLSVTEGDEVVVLLPENRTTGYRWLTEDDLRRRALRSHSSPPGLDTSANAATVQHGWTPQHRSAESVKATDGALARIPGGTGAVRVLHTPSTPAAPSDGLPEPGPPLTVIDDRFQASRAPVPPDQRRAARRALAHEGRRAPDLLTSTTAIAGTGTRLLALRSAGEGPGIFQAVYSSAYDPNAAVTDIYQLDIDIAPGPAVLRRRDYLAIDLNDGDPDGGDSD